jgi:transcriptional regulator with XRE-family HTH domain
MDNNIYKMIRQKNITQIELAQIVGIEQTYLNLIIKRKITPTTPIMMRIANALEVPMEYLFLIER